MPPKIKKTTAPSKADILHAATSPVFLILLFILFDEETVPPFGFTLFLVSVMIIKKEFFKHATWN